MDKLILDEPLRSKLDAVQAEVELCDETGRTVGYFLSPPLHDRL
jgi:hypothetical protein